jgi:2'-5' RNA ligase
MADEEKGIRAFLAIELPAEILREIALIQGHLKKDVQGMIRWVRPEGIHLTLKFFGDISEADIATISRVMANQVNGLKPFSLDVRTVGVFPDMKRPRVIWLGIGGDVAPLIQFQQSLDHALHLHGYAKEERPFKPHLTLARIKEHKGFCGLEKITKKEGHDTAGCFAASELVLFRSRLTPQGANYMKLAGFPFSG